MAPSKNQEREAREARERLKRYAARQSVHAHRITRRRRDNLFAVLGIVAVAALATATQVFYFTAGPGMPEPVPSSSAVEEADEVVEENVGAVPSPELAEGREWTGSITLNEVELGITLDGEAAPQAAAVMIDQIQSSYVVGTSCHRLAESATSGFIQCGLNENDDEPFSFGPLENVPASNLYEAGTIAMARTGSAYGNGHQFFIVFGDTMLGGDTAGGYTVVGSVTSGLDELVDQIASGGIVGGAEDGAPVIATTITAATIQ